MRNSKKKKKIKERRKRKIKERKIKEKIIILSTNIKY